MGPRGSKGKKAGVPNWKKPLLYKAVKNVLPTSNAQSERVLKVYQKLSGEKTVRELKTLKRYWKETCYYNRQPTGKSGKSSLLINTEIVTANKVK
jgi:hypothetical protein